MVRKMRKMALCVKKRDSLAKGIKNLDIPQIGDAIFSIL